MGGLKVAAAVMVFLLGAGEPAKTQRPLATKGGLRTLDYEIRNCNLVWTGDTATTRTERRCYNDWKSRPVSPLSECPGAERNGALCYPACSEGYSGAGPVCWQQCPPGYTDDGAFCRRDVRIIGADNSRCPWYDKCGLTFERGCSTCPPGYHNDGCTCRIDVHIFAKDTYTRGAGEPMSCAAGRQRIGALCYGDCPSGYTASGTYCNAKEETCEDVPVQEPGPPLKAFCFRLDNPASWARPCFGYEVVADTEEHAETLAVCQNPDYAATAVSCERISNACQ
jgi:hypothetical protein